MDIPQKNKTVIILSLLTIVGGIAVMAGWICNIPVLQGIVPGLTGIKFNTGLCFVLFGGALLCSQYNTCTYSKWLFAVLPLLGAIIGFITILQTVFYFNSGLDQLFITDKTKITPLLPYPGRMAFNSCVNFFLLGAGFLGLTVKNRLFNIFSQYIFHLVTLLSAIALIGYLYGVSLYHLLFYITAMPAHTAALFFILSIGAALINPALGITKLFTGTLVGNQMARRLFSLIILMVLLFGSLRAQTHHSKLFSSMDIGISILAACFLLVSLFLIWDTANWLNKIDRRRYDAEDRVRSMNTELEKRVEERSAELREAELKFRTIADKSMVGVYIVQHDTFTYVNPRFAQVFGYDPAELIHAQNLVELIFHESYHAIIAEHVRRRLEGEVESIYYEAIGKKKDGSNNWVEIYGNRVIIGGKPAIIGSMIDITERKQAEEELKSSEQKYKLLFESNPMPMWMIAKDTLTIIAANNAAARHYGYTKSELMNMDVKLLRPKEDSKHQMEGYLKQMDGPLGVVRHLKKDGTVMFMQVIAHDIIFEGRPVRLSLTNDVTEKLKAEESLQKSEANLQAILKTTDTAYALFDRDLKVLASNQKATEFIKEQYGHKPGNTNRLADYFPHERFPELDRFANDVLKGNNINFEVDFEQADGSVLWYYVRLFPIINDHKAILGILMALYDITERKNAEQDLKTAYGRIQSHINSIKDMAWKQSHLIRSPLANLKGLITLLKNDVSDPGVLDHIQTELDRMDAIIIEMAEDASDHE